MPNGGGTSCSKHRYPGWKQKQKKKNQTFETKKKDIHVCCRSPFMRDTESQLFCSP